MRVSKYYKTRQMHFPHNNELMCRKLGHILNIRYYVRCACLSAFTKGIAKWSNRTNCQQCERTFQQ